MGRKVGAEVLIAVGLGVGRFVFGPFVGLNDGLLLGLEEKQNMSTTEAWNSSANKNFSKQSTLT